MHAKLHITPTEEAQWDQFAEVMRENARDMNKPATEHAHRIPSMDAVQDLKLYEQLAEAHVQRLQKLIPAFEGPLQHDARATKAACRPDVSR